MLTFGLIVEGTSDAAALPECIRKCVEADVEIAPRVCNPKGSLMKRFPGLLEEFRHVKQGTHVDKAVVVRDADRKEPETLMRDMAAKIAHKSYPFPVQFVVIVQELETWLLADNAALSQVCNRPVPEVQGTLEEIVDPKMRLGRILAEARVAYTPAVAGRIAAAISLERIAYRCPSFRSFRQALSD